VTENILNAAIYEDSLNHKRTNQKNKSLLVILSIVVFAVCAFDIPWRMPFYQTTDAFRSFFIAYEFAGYDWSAVADVIGYGSYGFGMVFVLPFVLIFGDNSVAVYRCALVINALLTASMAPLSYYMLKQWRFFDYSERKITLAITILFFVLTPIHVIYGRTELIETLIMVVAMSSVCVFLIIQRGIARMRWYIVFAALLVFGYAVHNRFLGVMAAGVVLAIILKIVKKCGWREFIAFSFSYVFLFVCNLWIKRYVQSEIYGYENVGFGSADVGNDASISFMLENIASAFTENIKQFIPSLLSKYWAISFASFLLTTVGIAVICAECWKILTTVIKRHSVSPAKDADLSGIFVALAFVANFMITAVSGQLIGGRADFLIYTRYNDIIYIPLAIYAFIYLTRKHTRKNKLVIGTVIAAIITTCIVIYCMMRFLSYLKLFYYPIPQLVPFFQYGGQILAAAFFGLLLFAGLVIGTNGKRAGFVLLPAMLISIAYALFAGWTYMTYEINPQINDSINLYSVTDAQLPDGEPIYYVSSDIYSDQINLPRIQYAFPSKKIIAVEDLNTVRELKQPFVLATSALFDPQIENADIDFLNTGKDFSLVRLNDHETDAVHLPIELFSYSSIQPEGLNSILSSGQAGHLMYRNFIRLPAGNYIVTADIELLNSNAASGRVAVIEAYVTNRDGNYPSVLEPSVPKTEKALNSAEVYKNQFSENKATLELGFSLFTMTNEVGLRFFADHNAVFRLSNIRVKRLNIIQIPLIKYGSDFEQQSEGFFISDGIGGALLRGPNIAFAPGRYKAEYDLTLVSAPANDLGAADVVYAVREAAGGTKEYRKLRHMYLKKDMFRRNETYTVTIEFEITFDDVALSNGIANSVETRVFVDQNVVMSVNNMRITELERYEEDIITGEGFRLE
jgi:hypothetical protein